MKNVIMQKLQRMVLVIVTCTAICAFGAESRISSKDYGTFAYKIIMTHPWNPAMERMIQIAWASWSPEERIEIANRVPNKNVLPPGAEKFISRTDFCTIAYMNIMNKSWESSFGNLIDNCWYEWSEKQKSEILDRLSQQNIRHMRSEPTEKMLRHDID